MHSRVIRGEVIIFLLALLVRTGYVLFFVELEYLFSEDQVGYVKLAQQIKDSGFLGLSSETVPGYPFFISSIYDLFGESVWNVVLVQILLDSISCVMIALMAKSLFNKGFLVAGILSAMNLNMVILSATILTDTLFLFLFILFLFSLLKYFQSKHIGWLFLLILFISLSTLVRAASYYLIPILLVVLVIWRIWQKDSVLKIFKLIFLYLIVVGVFLGGIHQRNYQQYGSTAFVSQTGTAMIGWVVPAVYQYSGQGSYKEGQIVAQKKLNASLKDDNLTASSHNPFESSAYQVSVAKKILSEMGILNVLKAWVTGATTNLLSPSVAFSPALRSIEHPSFYETGGSGMAEKLTNYIKSSGFIYLSILTIGTVMSVLFIFLAIVGISKIPSILPPVTVITLLILLGYFLAITGPIVGVKYRLPIEPLLTLFVSYAVISWKYFTSKNINLKI
jgi:4-amino-4-deoxy-L-arabinose transferase-like glycosyltransferase